MAGVGFRWLDILEKEFDKSFVDLDISIGDIESDEPDVVFAVRQKLSTLSSCFAQLVHKAQTIFQNSAKIEAELIHLRAELIDSRSRKDVLEQELHTLLLQLHSTQLSQLPGMVGSRTPDARIEPDVNIIKKKLKDELEKSPGNRNGRDVFKFSPSAMEMSQLRQENLQLMAENASLRNSILALNSEVYGAKLAAKYLDKELAGRIQQLQLLGREMRGELRDKLWRQLEAEILLQRHKTVVRACRRNSIASERSSASNHCPKPAGLTLEDPAANVGEPRIVLVRRKAGQGLGISITGGREHGVPILISELEPNGPAALTSDLYIGDAILSVNGVDLRQACHKEAVDILQKQSGDCRLEVNYIAADESDNSASEDGYNFHYRFFDPEVCDPSDIQSLHLKDAANTPTAPRTPESVSQSRETAEKISSNSTPSKETTHEATEAETMDNPPPKESPKTEKVDANLNANCPTNQQQQQVDNTANYNFNPTSPTLKLNLDEDKLSSILTQIVDVVSLDAKQQTYKIEQIDKILNNNFYNRQNQLEDTNFKCSTNSLVSENLSSPMQTSTDNFLDSEVVSTDMGSNDSHSPKIVQVENCEAAASEPFRFDHSLLEVKKFNEFCAKPKLYSSNETFSNPKSDQSLLDSAESCESSPLHKGGKDYGQRKPQKKLKSKRSFGIKTLQAIFGNNDGYSDISSTNSADEAFSFAQNAVKSPPTVAYTGAPKAPPKLEESALISFDSVESSPVIRLKQKPFQDQTSKVVEVSPEFDENIHQFLSDTFEKRGRSARLYTSAEIGFPNLTVRPANIRIGKALKLCPMDVDKEQRMHKEKLLARYVYNSKTLNADGIGDPDFGTPV